VDGEQFENDLKYFRLLSGAFGLLANKQMLQTEALRKVDKTGS
jgi:hypothetical protein